jgi:hypothetical protein
MFRLYNWDAKKGGAGIDDLPAILNNAVETTLKNMNGLAAYTADKAHRCQASQGLYLEILSYLIILRKVTRRASGKNRTKCSPTHFLSKLMHNFYCGKSSTNVLSTFVI